jgi:AraC family transcriptional activator of pobA
MSKKTVSIPVKSLPKEFDKGIAVERISVGNLHNSEEALHSHRHDFHFFILQAKGTSHFEIDFKKHRIKKPAVLYIHPNQVHRVVKIEQVDFYMLAISNDNLNPAYLKLLEDIMPASPLSITARDFSLFIQAISLCIDLFERKGDKLYLPLLKDSCNTLVGLIVSQYVALSKPADRLSRCEVVTKAFKAALEQKYLVTKSPSDYASTLHISAPYLNECVRNVTGFPVSHHIQQRVILEARRLLYHSNKSVKEIAAELGYDDHAYFSRVFTRLTGMTALAFRNKNLD